MTAIHELDGGILYGILKSPFLIPKITNNQLSTLNIQL
jgi:hypothetical protein